MVDCSPSQYNTSATIARHLRFNFKLSTNYSMLDISSATASELESEFESRKFFFINLYNVFFHIGSLSRRTQG